MPLSEGDPEYQTGDNRAIVLRIGRVSHCTCTPTAVHLRTFLQKSTQSDDCVKPRPTADRSNNPETKARSLQKPRNRLIKPIFSRPWGRSLFKGQRIRVASIQKQNTNADLGNGILFISPSTYILSSCHDAALSFSWLAQPGRTSEQLTRTVRGTATRLRLDR
jgi:hypothetical protein